MRRVLWMALSVLLGFGLEGCGGGSPGTSPAAPVPANVSGNWLLAGSLPLPALGFSATPVPVGLALNFDVSGNQILAAGSFRVPCAGSTLPTASGGTALLAGTVGADGSFTLTTSGALLGPLLTLQGTVPSAASQPWSGTYAFPPAAGPPLAAR